MGEKIVREVVAGAAKCPKRCDGRGSIYDKLVSLTVCGYFISRDESRGVPLTAVRGRVVAGKATEGCARRVPLGIRYTTLVLGPVK